MIDLGQTKQTPLTLGKKRSAEKERGHPKGPTKDQKGQDGKANIIRKVKIKVPKQAAVILTAVDSEKTSVSDALLKIRDRIDIKSIGISYFRPRKTLTGPIIYEIPRRR